MTGKRSFEPHEMGKTAFSVEGNRPPAPARVTENRDRPRKARGHGVSRRKTTTPLARRVVAGRTGDPCTPLVKTDAGVAPDLAKGGCPKEVTDGPPTRKTN